MEILFVLLVFAVLRADAYEGEDYEIDCISQDEDRDIEVQTYVVSTVFRHHFFRR